ncbi:MAG: hypothetical protein JO270_24780 [Acidobacteriaceae bacterium]|nr:hypothetical protein [Acidobacteriaceae bacterium]MBV8569465.1 hypothetical protein [Acidobacteriaceae bacterium]
MNRKRSHPACSGSAYPKRIIEQEKYFTLYTRYQTTHEHAFSNCLSDLLKLRAERRKAEKDEAALYQQAQYSRTAFESQKRGQADQYRKRKLIKLACRSQTPVPRFSNSTPSPRIAPVRLEQLKHLVKIAMEEVLHSRHAKRDIKQAA